MESADDRNNATPLLLSPDPHPGGYLTDRLEDDLAARRRGICDLVCGKHLVDSGRGARLVARVNLGERLPRCDLVAALAAGT